MRIQKGFTLVEVLVFTTILSLFFVVAAAVTTSTLRNMKINEHKILATRYAEELVEWIRSDKENNWNTFIARDTVSGSAGATYCFNTLAWQAVGGCGVNELMGTPQIFKREAVIKDSGGFQADIVVTVTWAEVGAPTQTVTHNTRVGIWE